MRQPDRPDEYESLHDLFGVLRKYKFTVLLVALAVPLLIIGACLLLTPKYSSTATLEVNRDTAAAANGPNDPSGPAQPDDVKTEVETDATILQQNSLALEVIRDQHLADHPPFNKAVAPSEKGLPLDRAPLTRDKYLKLFAKALKVEPVPDSRLIQITFRNPDPQIAANVANAVTETFIREYLERRLSSTSQLSFWISKQLDSLKQQVQQSEQALADFERKTGLSGVDVSASPQGGDAVVVQPHNTVLDRLTALNQQLSQAEANRISTETVYRLMQTEEPEVVLGLGSMTASTGGSVIAQGGGLDLLRSLRAQEVPLKVEYADISTKYGAKNPRLAQLQNQLNAMDAEIKAEVKRLSSRAKNDYLYAKRNEDAIRAELTKQQSAADTLTDQTVQLQLLAQEAFSNRKLYQSLFSQLNQANVSAGIHSTRLDVVEHAQVAGTPYFPNYLLIVPISIGLGILFGIAAAFLRQSLDQSVSLPQDVEDAVHLPVLAHLPLFAQGRNILPTRPGDSVLISDPESHLSESFRALRTAIMLSRPVAGCKTLLITSPLASDGKTTVSYNLAVAFAQQGNRVLLIDGDMRNADLHRHFGTTNEGGLSEALSQQAGSLFRLLSTHTDLSNLQLLPAGAKPNLPAELFSTATFDRLLSEAKLNFDWVLIDTPPFLAFADAAILSAKVDAVLPVLRSGVTSRAMLMSITRLLQRMRAPVIGFVLNGVKGDAMSPFYSYGYHRKNQEQDYVNS